MRKSEFDVVIEGGYAARVAGAVAEDARSASAASLPSIGRIASGTVGGIIELYRYTVPCTGVGADLALPQPEGNSWRKAPTPLLPAQACGKFLAQLANGAFHGRVLGRVFSRDSAGLRDRTPRTATRPRATTAADGRDDRPGGSARGRSPVGPVTAAAERFERCPKTG